MWFTVVLSAVVMIAMKPYIFMILFPMTILWLMYLRMVALRNVLVKFVLVPLAVAIVVGVSLFVLVQLGSSFDKFALDGALQTVQVTQADLVNASAYGSNSFDVGTIDDSWASVLSKFPIATNAALFRPYIWESNNFVMVLSGLENLWVLGLTLYALYVAGPRFFFRASIGIPILMMSMAFALLFAFMVGVTTPNFGALVRFKIPMVPFYISSLFIIIYLAKLKRKRENQGLRFNLKGYRMGTAHLLLEAKEERNARKQGPGGKRSVGGMTGPGRHR